LKRPALGLGRHVGESSVAVIVIKVAVEAGNIKICPAVVAVIGGGSATL
jgi:hypothetical protein